MIAFDLQKWTTLSWNFKKKFTGNSSIILNRKLYPVFSYFKHKCTLIGKIPFPISLSMIITVKGNTRVVGAPSEMLSVNVKRNHLLTWKKINSHTSSTWLKWQKIKIKYNIPHFLFGTYISTLWNSKQFQTNRY